MTDVAPVVAEVEKVAEAVAPVVEAAVPEVAQASAVVKDLKSVVSDADKVAPSLLRAEAVRLLQHIENSSAQALLPLVDKYTALAKDIEAKL